MNEFNNILCHNVGNGLKNGFLMVLISEVQAIGVGLLHFVGPFWKTQNTRVSRIYLRLSIIYCICLCSYAVIQH